MNRRLFLRNLSGLGILAAIPSAFRSVFMADYPGTLPTFAANGANLSTAPHSALHTDLNQEVVAIATALGTNPQGTLSTVKARLDKIAPYTGAMTPYTPVVNQNAIPTITDEYSRYIRIGRLIIGWFNVVCTSAGTASNVITVSLPVTAGGSNGALVGTGVLVDVSPSPDAGYKALLQLHSTFTAVSFKLADVTSADDDRLGVHSFTAALASGDTLRGQFVYEAAAD